MKKKNKVNSISKKQTKRTRGYRLKPSTHKLILKIQELIRSDQDAAIAGACRMYYSELLKNVS